MEYIYSILFRVAVVLLIAFLVPKSLRNAISAKLKNKLNNFHSKERGAYIALALIYVFCLVVLYIFWYSKSGFVGFHLFDDKTEWLYLDKFGHIYASYFEATLVYRSLIWAKTKKHKAIIVSVILALMFQMTIEIFDGYSESWGFSIYDMIANLLGVTAFITQYALLKHQYFSLKFSFFLKNIERVILSSAQNAISTTTSRYSYLFGDSVLERLVKDYNCQTYWVSINMRLITGIQLFPSWFNISFGYGAKNMLGGNSNNWYEGENLFSAATALPRTPQVYIGFDLDLTSLNVTSTFLRNVLGYLNLIRCPLPTLKIENYKVISALII